MLKLSKCRLQGLPISEGKLSIVTAVVASDPLYQVNSTAFETATPNIRGWHLGHRWSPYGYPPANRQNSYPPPHPAGYNGINTGYDYSAFTAIGSSPSWTRGQMAPMFNYSYEDDTPATYASQYPPYLLPSTDSVSATNAYPGSPLSSKQWVPAAQPTRGQQSGLFPEIPSSNGPASIGHQYVPLAQLQNAIPNESLYSAGMPSATNSLSSDRLLPNPAATRNGSTFKMTQTENSPLTLANRGPNSWPLDSAPNGTLPGSRAISAGMSEESDTGFRSASSSGPQEANFEFLAVSQSSPEGAVQAAAAVTSTDANQPAVYEMQKLAVTNISQVPSGQCAHGSLADHQEASLDDAYTYGSETFRRDSTRDALAGQLTNGQEYARLRSGSSQHGSPFSKFRLHESPDFQSSGFHRASISSINNSAGY